MKTKFPKCPTFIIYSYSIHNHVMSRARDRFLDVHTYASYSNLVRTISTFDGHVGSKKMRARLVEIRH